MALKPPVEVPQGAIRLNTDSQKLEFYAQDQWWEMATDVPTLDGGARGLFGGGYTPTAVNTIDYITIESAGNAIDFGDLTYTDNNVCSSTASRTRGMWFGGGTEPNLENDNINYVTIASTGDAADFGNLTQARRGSAAVASATRAVICGGRTPTVVNTMDYVTMASTGNAVDFGDIVGKNDHCSSCSPAASPTRGILAGGTGTSQQKDISYITISTLGNDRHFGDLSATTDGVGGCSNSTRAIFRIRESTTIDSIQIATRGNGTSFAEGVSGVYGNFANSPTRAVYGMYTVGTPGTAVTDMSYTSLQTGGGSIDFGDLTQARKQRNGGCSNAHGGL